jgi:hypothetical protein
VIPSLNEPDVILPFNHGQNSVEDIHVTVVVEWVFVSSEADVKKDAVEKTTIPP